MLHDLRRIALGIDGDEIGLKLVAGRVHLLHPAVQLEQRRWADFRAMGETEEQRCRLALKGFFGNRLAGLRRQFERHAIGRLHHLLPGFRHFDRQPADDTGENEHDGPQYDANISHFPILPRKPAAYRRLWQTDNERRWRRQINWAYLSRPR
ncbi:hypothetical protein D3C86_1690100 [compost metagenome]